MLALFTSRILNVRICFLKNQAESEAGRLVPKTFLFPKKALYKGKTSGQHVSFNIFW